MLNFLSDEFKVSCTFISGNKLRVFSSVIGGMENFFLKNKSSIEVLCNCSDTLFAAAKMRNYIIGF